METNSVLKMRGTIIQVPGNTPGLLLVGGEQKQFSLQHVWRSPVAPAPNMTVDIEITAGIVTSITVVEAQKLAKEKLEQFSGVARVQGQEAAGLALQGLLATAGRMGKVTLAATVLIWIIWFTLPAITFNNFMFQRSFTFWDLVGLDLKTGLVNHGLFSLIALLALAAPICAPYFKSKVARWLYAAPLTCTVIAFFSMYSQVHGMVGAAQEAMGSDASRELEKLVSFRAGLYLLLLLGLIIAARALRSFNRRTSVAEFATPALLLIICGASPARLQAHSSNGYSAGAAPSRAVWFSGPPAESLWNKLGQSSYAQEGNSGMIIYMLSYSSCPNCTNFLNDFWLPRRNRIQLRELFAPINRPNLLNECADVALTRDAAIVEAYYHHARVAPAANSSPERITALQHAVDLFAYLDDVFIKINHITGGYPTFIFRYRDAGQYKVNVVSGFGPDFANALDKILSQASN